MVALRIGLFPCNISIRAVLTDFNSTRQRIQVKTKAKIFNLWLKSYLNAIKTRKSENWLFLQNHFAFTLSNLVKYVVVYKKTTLFWKLQFSAFTKTTDTFNKNKRWHITFEGMISVCAKLEPASFKNNEILQINVLQKFTSHALSLRPRFGRGVWLVRSNFFTCSKFEESLS